jgi:RNA polymerase sigma-70 factor (ECF subfamily)
LQRFMAALQRDDMTTLETLLADDVRSVSDGGEYAAGQRPVVGRQRVARLFRGLMRKGGHGAGGTVRMLNGLPALVLVFAPPHRRWAPRGVVRCDLDDEGRIRALHTVLASRKLTALAP